MIYYCIGNHRDFSESMRLSSPGKKFDIVLIQIESYNEDSGYYPLHLKNYQLLPCPPLIGDHILLQAVIKNPIKNKTRPGGLWEVKNRYLQSESLIILKVEPSEFLAQMIEDLTEKTQRDDRVK